MADPIKTNSKQLDNTVGVNSASGMYVNRQPFVNPMYIRPILTDTLRWRMVAAEPINKLARRAVQREISTLNWVIKPVTKEYEEAARWYNYIFSDMRQLVSKILKGVCELPQGGALEAGRMYPGLYGEMNGTLTFVKFIDAGTLHPTTDTAYPIIQIDPYQTLRRVWFQQSEIIRFIAFPYDEFDKEWWQESPTMASFMQIEALSRIYIYYLKQLHDTPVAGILDLMDFEESKARRWATSFREMLEGIDPIKIPIIYEHTQAAKWLPMGRNPSELSIQEQFKQYAEMTLANYGLSLEDLRLFNEGSTKAGGAVGRKISMNSGIGFFAELIKDTIQAQLPEGCICGYDDPDIEDERTRAMIRASDARTIQSFPWLPAKYKVRLANSYGIFKGLDMNPDEIEKEVVELTNSALVGGTGRPTPGQIERGEGPTRNLLEDNARDNAATGTVVYSKSETEEIELIEETIQDKIDKAVQFFKDEYNPDSVYGRKKERAANKMQSLLEKKFRKIGKKVNSKYIEKYITAIYTQFPQLNTQIDSTPMQIKSLTDEIPEVYIGNKKENEVKIDTKRDEYHHNKNVQINIGSIFMGDKSYINKDDDEDELKSRVEALIDQLQEEEKNPPYLLSKEDIISLLLMYYVLAYEDGMLAVSEMIQSELYKQGISPNVNVDLVFGLVDPKVIKILEDMAVENVRNIDTATKNFLRRMIIEGAMQGLSVDEIARRIQLDLFGLPEGEVSKFNPYRIRSIVTTELNAADSAGRLEEMRRIGLKLKRWITRLVDVCVLCLDNEDKGSVPLDFMYQDVFGETLHPPGHPSTCHCTLGADEDEIRKLGTVPEYWTGK